MLRVGIIGVGNIAEAHVDGYRRFPEECEIVALHDVVAGKAAARGRDLGLDAATTYDDLDEMLATARLDLVSIATPPATHSELTIRALRAGVDVLVEKPMAPSLEECDAMIAAAAENGRMLSVVAQNRFRDDMATLKEVLDSGLAGPVSHVQVSSAWWRGLPYYDLWWRGTWESEGGGCTLNHAIHHLDLTLWMLGSPRAVTAVLANTQHENAEVEDLSVAVLQYDRALAEVTSSVVHHGEEQAIVVQARDARVSQPWKVVASTSGANGFPLPEGNPDLVDRIEALAAGHAPLPHEGHRGQIGDMLAAVRDRRPPAIDGEDGRRAVELVTAIYAAGIERRTVDLPLRPDDPYYRTGTLTQRAPHFFEKTSSVADLPGEIIVGGSGT
ncbi:Gfo/Idh/MocA family oxidoreductase [Microbacterium paludicola]|uniref:Gfo/Idh/MocA family oxidoreductase n=1 Tax=Microbacterium paludicola TaxID=300019 RepID=A0A4Y9FQD4_9MICO|nr:Gfo/Idh/MocA family oxidoreductase [Microbacterium paludicola]MBF0817565.1 Gfo/Idh/MocA family oxidoreductase [Microbacterium paludicola]TFU30723.1 Gfo/Idh/MocA family oxidoreductase [Microbacterium paludicola]